MSMLDINNVSLLYQDKPVLERLNLTLSEGELACLLGPSGCGKTSLLRAIAGFETITEGDIRLQGELISSASQTLPAEQRHIGMMFQYFALFPHLDTAQNIQFGIRHLPRKERQSRTRQLLQLVNLPGIEQRYPHTLSGGQQQRVALARALAPRPTLLLMDEPFSSMDNDLREEIAREVRTILKQEGMTALLVTHDQNEAFAMADQIAILNAGRIEQTGPAHCLYQRPLTRFVADFIGEGSFLRAEASSDRRVSTLLGNVDASADTRSLNGPLEIMLRPEDIALSDTREGGLHEGTVVESLFRGTAYLYSIKLADGQIVKAAHNGQIPYPAGQRLGVSLKTDHAPVFQMDP